MYAAASRASLKITGPDLTHQELLHHFTGHLVDEEYSYFVHWDRLIDLEADASGSLVARAWLRESDDLEADTSKSVSSLVFDPAVSSPDAVFDESWFSRIGFKRSPTSRIQTPLSTIGLEPGCRVIVSADSTSLLHSSFSNSRHSNVVRPQMHIMRSVVHNVDDTHLRLLASRDDLTRIENIVKAAPLQRIMFRLDRDDSATGIGMLRQNIVNLFTGDMRSPEEPNSKIEQSRLTWLRDVLIRLRKPVYDNSLVKSMFAPNTRTTVCTVPGCDLMDLFFEFTTLNFDQQTAAEQVGHVVPRNSSRKVFLLLLSLSAFLPR